MLNQRKINSNHSKSCTTRTLHNTPKHKLKSDCCESCPGISETTGGKQTSGPHAVWIFVHVLFQAILTIRDPTETRGNARALASQQWNRLRKKTSQKVLPHKTWQRPWDMHFLDASCRVQTSNQSYLSLHRAGAAPRTRFQYSPLVCLGTIALSNFCAARGKPQDLPTAAIWPLLESQNHKMVHVGRALKTIKFQSPFSKPDWFKPIQPGLAHFQGWGRVFEGSSVKESLLLSHWHFVLNKWAWSSTWLHF